MLGLHELPSPARRQHLFAVTYISNSFLVMLLCWVVSPCGDRTELGGEDLPLLTQGSHVPDPQISTQGDLPIQTQNGIRVFSDAFVLPQDTLCFPPGILLSPFNLGLSPIFPVKHPPLGASGKRLATTAKH